MSNFLLILDADDQRRQQAHARARQRVGFLPHLQSGEFLGPDHTVAWAAAPSAPISQHSDSETGAATCLLFGEPHSDSGRTLNAVDFSRRQAKIWDAPADANGFYAALIFHPQQGFRIEADVLGIFPVYYWEQDDVLLVGTSPELFRCHASFASRLDLHGVAALLLTSGIVGGRTLHRGVRRLNPDHLLLRAPGSPAREIAPPSPLVESPIATLDDAVQHAASLHVDFLSAALKTSRKPGLQLSGGLDSRLLAGFVHTLGHRPACLTFGRSGDLDARCATQVAHELDLPQTLCESDAADYAAYASSCVQWEQLSGGLYSLAMGWNISVRPPPVQMDRMVCGLTLDAVIGGPKSVAHSDASLSFERLRIGRLGFDRERLNRLIRAPELSRACDDVREQLVDTYKHAGTADAEREWRMNLAHRHRFAVGVCAWRFSLYSWPVLPALDRRLIRLAARLPHAIADRRQVQTRMLITRFPQLARLEIDRNYADTFPLLGPKLSPLGEVRRRAVRWGRQAQTWLGRERRFYVRTMEINGPGWRVVRSLADHARTSATSLFKPAVVAELLPDARARIRGIDDPIIHATPLKNTLGVMLWLRQHA